MIFISQRYIPLFDLTASSRDIMRRSSSSPLLLLLLALGESALVCVRHRPPQMMGKKVSGPPPIRSREFKVLATPAEYEELLAGAAAEEVSVIKFQAPWCRTCRATAPLLDRKARKYPNASFYSIDLVRDGKAAGERMNKFFQAHNATKMPYIEVHVGGKLIDAEIVPSSSIELFDQAIALAFSTLKALPAAFQRRRLLQLLQQKRAERAPSKETGAARDGPAADRPIVPGSSAGPFAAGRRRPVSSAPPSAMGQQLQSLVNKPWRSSPQRGNTGGRRKGMR